jgi:ferredoxin
MKLVNQIYFSPTGTTRKIVNTIARSLLCDQEIKNDITHKPILASYTSSDLVIIAAPVYAGRLPSLMEERLEGLSGTNTRAIIIVVYGNRDYDDALLELYNRVTQKGFLVISAAAFVGEHSYSNKTYPIALNRPDEKDLRKASDYGSSLLSILNQKTSPHYNLDIPGRYPYKPASVPRSISPVSNDRCTMCLTCMEACPSKAIRQGITLETDPKKCILCSACIKICPNDAREFIDEKILNITENLYLNCRERKEPELFLP